MLLLLLLFCLLKFIKWKFFFVYQTRWKHRVSWKWKTSWEIQHRDWMKEQALYTHSLVNTFIFNFSHVCYYIDWEGIEIEIFSPHHSPYVPALGVCVCVLSTVECLYAFLILYMHGVCCMCTLLWRPKKKGNPVKWKTNGINLFTVHFYAFQCYVYFL